MSEKEKAKAWAKIRHAYMDGGYEFTIAYPAFSDGFDAGWKARVPEWRRIETDNPETLPKPGTWVLGSCVRNDGKCADAVWRVFFDGQGWTDENEDEFSADAYWRVVAWMPEPDPYRYSAEIEEPNTTPPDANKPEE